tara:strand:- start:6774 stop:6881 length:108 start_codon:yes stop_codon:yes gene_type:complete
MIGHFMGGKGNYTYLLIFLVLMFKAIKGSLELNVL